MSARARIQFPAEGAYPRAMRQCCAVTIAWLCLSATGVVHGQCQYEVTVVTGPPCFPDPNISVGFEGINDLGQACGWQAICGQVSALRPLVWTEEQGIILLPLPDGATRGVANDINNVLGSDGFGQVACTLEFPALGGSRAYVYDEGVWTVLAPTGSGNSSSADGINDESWVAGYRDTNTELMAYRWREDVVDELASLIRGESARAKDINEFFEDATGRFGALINGEAFLWQGDRVTIIPPVIGATSSDGQGINNHSVVTGQSLIDVKSGPVPRRSWVFENGQITDLGIFPDADHHNIAEDINDARQVVGTCYGESGCCNTPYLWQDGELFRLRDLIELPPQVLGFANVKAINNRGQIVGMSGGASHGLILTPNVPLGDVNLDCEVNGKDLTIVLSDWGPDKLGHIADIVTNATFQPPGDGVVDGADLAVVLGNWTERTSSQSRRN